MLILNEPVSLSRPLSSNNLQDQEQKGDRGGGQVMKGVRREWTGNKGVSEEKETE